MLTKFGPILTLCIEWVQNIYIESILAVCEGKLVDLFGTDNIYY